MKEIEIEINQLTPDQARAWCDALRVDWRNYIDEKASKPETWINILQKKAWESEE
jgi:hypothetical protein